MVKTTMPSIYKHPLEVIGAVVTLIITLIITSRVMGHIYRAFGESVMSTIAPLFSALVLTLVLVIAATLIIVAVTVIRYLRDQF
jgi:flagellar biosynthesis protein FlhB